MDIYHQGSSINPNGEDMLSFCSSSGIQLMAYSPLNAWPFLLSPLKDIFVEQVSNATSRTPAQVLLRWALQRGAGVITRSTDPVHIRENLQVLDFQLSNQDMIQLDALSWFVGSKWNKPISKDVFAVSSSTCVDESENCVAWSKQGECDNNNKYMEESCPMACHVCQTDEPIPPMKKIHFDSSIEL
mmetsp:Transcript_37499/g.52048  ORF Transcript_37499/g.52048 Transcript_37499/m.52048 type:complete len:186 (-) Transcript_37499:77-634(-)